MFSLLPVLRSGRVAVVVNCTGSNDTFGRDFFTAFSWQNCVAATGLHVSTATSWAKIQTTQEEVFQMLDPGREREVEGRGGGGVRLKWGIIASSNHGFSLL